MSTASGAGPAQSAKRVLLANPRGFCAGVVRAIDAVEQALAVHGAPVYVRRPIVHNQTVIERLERLGAIFVREFDDVPEGAVAMISAHGVAPSIWREGRARHLRLIDATCPLVTKVHLDVLAHFKAGRHVLLIGHRDHPEVVGTLGQIPPGAITVVSTADDLGRLLIPANLPVAYAVQTTFSTQEARAIIAGIAALYPDVTGPRASNICYATTNRQTAIERIAEDADYVLVVGDPMSSNANRLAEVALAAGCSRASLVARASDIDWQAIGSVATVGLTAAASAPETSVREICDALSARGFSIVEMDGPLEKVSFKPVSVCAKS